MAEKTLQLVQDKGSVNLRMHFYLLVVFIFAVAGIFLMVLEVRMNVLGVYFQV